MSNTNFTTRPPVEDPDKYDEIKHLIKTMSASDTMKFFELVRAEVKDHLSDIGDASRSHIQTNEIIIQEIHCFAKTYGF